MDFKVIIFDLDGTLSDPKTGIINCVKYALNQMNVNAPDHINLEKFIGPPLQVSFKELLHFKDAKVHMAIQHYRERFKSKGLFEQELYPHISELLKTLNEKGYMLAIATSKPTIFAEQITKHFHIEHFFEHIIGSNLDGTRIHKADIIFEVMNRFKSLVKEDFIMVGDRIHDLAGAKEAGIPSIAVSYGYGSREELLSGDPAFLVESVKELEKLLIGERNFEPTRH